MMHPDLSQMIVQDRDIERHAECRRSAFQTFDWTHVKAGLVRRATALRLLVLGQPRERAATDPNELEMGMTASSRQ